MQFAFRHRMPVFSRSTHPSSSTPMFAMFDSGLGVPQVPHFTLA